jgi:hypothetical protein
MLCSHPLITNTYKQENEALYYSRGSVWSYIAGLYPIDRFISRVMYEDKQTGSKISDFEMQFLLFILVISHGSFVWNMSEYYTYQKGNNFLCYLF